MMGTAQPRVLPAPCGLGSLQTLPLAPPRPCVRFLSPHFLFSSLSGHRAAGCLFPSLPVETVCLEHPDVQGALPPLGPGPRSPEGHEQQGEGGPARQKGSPGLALAPGAQDCDFLLHSCPPPLPLAAGESPGRCCHRAEGRREGRRNPGGKTDSPSLTFGDLSREPPGTERGQGETITGWRAALSEPPHQEGSGHKPRVWA